MKIRKSLPVFTTFVCCPKCCPQCAQSHTAIHIKEITFQTKMEKKKGKVDDVKDEKEEGEKKDDESDPTPSVGLFELVGIN